MTNSSNLKAILDNLFGKEHINEMALKEEYSINQTSIAVISLMQLVGIIN